MRQKLVGLTAVGAAMTLVLTACGGDGGDDEELSQGFEDCAEDPNNCNSGERQDGGEIIWTLDQGPTGYQTMTNNGGSVYTAQAIQGILPYTGQHMPNDEYQHNLDLLVEPPEIVNEDPLQTRWRIRPEAVWNDGTPITAEDVIMTWKMTTRESEGHCVGCEPRAFDDTIADIESSDDGKTYTVTYQDGVSDPEWFAYMGTADIASGFLPAHVAEQNGFDINDPEQLGEYFHWLHENPPTFSGGPYLIEEFDLDEGVVVKVPNPQWYGETRPTLERVVITHLQEDNWVQALGNGELHGGSPAGWAPDVIEQMLTMDNLRLHRQLGPSWEHIDYNLNNERFQDEALRKAIFTVIDREDMAQRIYGDLFPDIRTRGSHMFGADSEYYVDHIDGTGQGSGDVELAREILADAGYDGYQEGEGPLTRDGEPVGELRLRATSAPARVTSLQLIQGYLEQIGIETVIDPIEDLGDVLAEQDYDIIQFGWSGSPLFTDIAEQQWQSESGSNFGDYSNERVDELIDDVEQAQTLDEAAELVNEINAIVVSDAYVLPLYTTPVYIFVTDQYVGVRDNTNVSLRALYETKQWGLAAE